MGIFARSLGLARVTLVVGGYAFMYPHSLSGSFSTISSDPWIARRGAPQKRGSQEKQRLVRNNTDAGSARNLLDYKRLLESTNLPIRDSYSNKMQYALNTCTYSIGARSV
jgi:hypothetical protein